MQDRFVAFVKPDGIVEERSGQVRLPTVDAQHRPTHRAIFTMPAHRHKGKDHVVARCQVADTWTDLVDDAAGFVTEDNRGRAG